MSNDRFGHMPDPHIEQIRQVQYNRKHTEYQYFPEEYFSGSDVTIYFGDTWVDDITGLQFGLHEPVKPVHGYASYTWDAVSRGARMVQGQFRIAFKEAGYLHVILDHLAQLEEKAKPRLAYLMGDEEVPSWVAGVKDNIEGLLNRYHGNEDAKSKDPDTYKDEEYLDEFEWPTLKHVRLDSKMTDAKTPNTKGRKRQGLVSGKHSHKGEQYLGSISQLQSRLIELGITWGPWKWKEGSKAGKAIDWKKSDRPSTNHSNKHMRISPTVFSVVNPKENWYLVRRYYDNRYDKLPSGKGHNSTIGSGATYDFNMHWERELQYRLESYPGGLKGFYMGGKNGRYDGRYGSAVNDGVAMFEDLAYIPKAKRAKNGDWLTDTAFEELKKGFDVTGVFDTPTRIAVMLFQNSKGLKMDGIVGPKTREALSPNAKRTVTIPGKETSYHSPDKVFEPRVSQYEKEVWGRAASADIDHKRRTFFYYRMNGNEWLKKNGFDIYITYGPYPESVIKEKGQMATGLSSDKAEFNTTVKAIRNVQLTGVQQILDTSGNPVEEAYTFIAKDLD